MCRVNCGASWESNDDDAHVVTASLWKTENIIFLGEKMKTNLVETSINNLVTNGFKVVMNFHSMRNKVANVFICHHIPNS